jgi:hypothetical protein
VSNFALIDTTKLHTTSKASEKKKYPFTEQAAIWGGALVFKNVELRLDVLQVICFRTLPPSAFNQPTKVYFVPEWLLLVSSPLS